MIAPDPELSNPTPPSGAPSASISPHSPTEGDGDGIIGALAHVRARIAEACRRTGRDPASVCLVAVSKTFPAANVRAAAAAGQRDFGENYLQETLDKQAALSDLRADPRTGLRTGLIWHFIGPIQSNKTRQIAQSFDWVHSIDRDKVARRLAEQRDAQLPPLQCCIQVNVSGEQSKSGIAPAELPALAAVVAGLPRLALRGLMAIPEPTDDAALARSRFAQLRELMATLNRDGHKLDTLSMGMTADMDAAIAEGATMVRVGTAIFGNRVGTSVSKKD
jgi:pyridoxal phosphate enzyme (YggS family)